MTCVLAYEFYGGPILNGWFQYFLGDENGGRRRRRRKPPQRFMEAVAGKELDRMLREEGAIDGFESDDSVLDEHVPIVEVRIEESADSETFDTTAGNGGNFLKCIIIRG